MGTCIMWLRNIDRLLDSDTVSFRRWDEIKDNVNLLSRVKWAKVKAIHRAVEKLYRSYGLEVAMLLDVCRQVFTISVHPL